MAITWKEVCKNIDVPMPSKYRLNRDRTLSLISFAEMLEGFPGQSKRWRQWFRVNEDYIRIKGVRFRVSTVFLEGSGPGLLEPFETMIFGMADEYEDLYQERYETWDEAEAGHARVVKWLLNKPRVKKRRGYKRFANQWIQTDETTV